MPYSLVRAGRMSVMRGNFHRAILSSRYEEAVLSLNGLNMAEMLPALAAVGKDRRTEIGKTLVGAIGKVNVPRIQYALMVVQDLQVPPGAPGDLAATGQVNDAKSFVAIPSIFPQILPSADAAAILRD